MEDGCGKMTNGCGRIMNKVVAANYAGQRWRSDGGMMRSSIEMGEDNGKQQDFATRTAVETILEEVEVAGMGVEGRTFRLGGQINFSTAYIHTHINTTFNVGITAKTPKIKPKKTPFGCVSLRR